VPLRQALALAARAGAGRPRRTEYLGRLALSVPTGYTILQAALAGPGRPSDGYFVLRGFPSLTNHELATAKAGTAPGTRTPDVELGFTADGRTGFETMTRSIARQGAALSSPGQALNQHFAIVLDNRLIEVPFVDYSQYPDGVNGDQGAELVGNLTTRSAKDLAIVLRYGRLPLTLTAAG
jgi:SecD/SecF fusion protein